MSEPAGPLHYPFPPASAYALNRCLYLIKSDPEFRARFARDPDGAAVELGLGPAERAALVGREREALVALGGHPYLVFMAELQLRMAAGASGPLEHF